MHKNIIICCILAATNIATLSYAIVQRRARIKESADIIRKYAEAVDVLGHYSNALQMETEINNRLKRQLEDAASTSRLN